MMITFYISIRGDGISPGHVLPENLMSNFEFDVGQGNMYTYMAPFLFPASFFAINTISNLCRIELQNLFNTPARFSRAIQIE